MLKRSLLLYLEPVNGAKPRVASTAKYDVLGKSLGATVTMSCQAQGHPLPNFRKFKRILIINTNYFLEPVNGAAPRVAATAKITVLTSSANSSITMLCQAQANPLPIFRSIIVEPVGSGPPRLPPRSKFDELLKHQGTILTLLCEAQGSPTPFYR
ncbi:hypothetical protein G9C98_005514 [Cotesia typhae]|uniref:Uncharacterized protein n=1 Tax=Cotesia typhae TaxID=2053667 RepID=A0A8J5R469_9HYME|nr:hypothetical protein G9C98_005514 [Cotesia typhae]